MEQVSKYKPWIILGVIVIILFMIYGTVTGSYNSLVSEREEAITQEAQIETQMQRRADLVPSIVAATRGGMQQERAVFEEIAKAYANFQNAPAGTPDKVSAGDGLAAALRGYLVVVQQYPKLASLDLVKDLTVTLEGSENRISVARQRYNESVRDYNRHRQTFPANFIANNFGFEKMEPFEASEQGKQVPAVNLEFEK